MGSKNRKNTRARPARATNKPDSTRRPARRCPDTEAAELRATMRDMLLPDAQRYVDESLAGAFNTFTRFVADHYPGATLRVVVEAHHAAIGARLEQQVKAWAESMGVRK